MNFEFLNLLKAFIAFLQTKFSYKIKAFKSDGGTEFTNIHVHAFLMIHALILHNKTVELNGHIVILPKPA